MQDEHAAVPVYARDPLAILANICLSAAIRLHSVKGC